MGPADTKGFDLNAFYRALEGTVSARALNWRQVAEQTGVGPSTLTRMSQGRCPDASSLAALSAWAGLNPSDFVLGQKKTRRPEAMSQISSLLRSDPNLDRQAAETLEAILRTAYERFRKGKT